MAAAVQREKSHKMAEDLRKRGIYHGKRTTKPKHANYPALTEVGSTKYQRMTAKNQAKNR